MIRDSAALMADPAEFDADYYVIDEPPTPEPKLHDPMDYRVVREQLLQTAIPDSAPRFQIYWTVPLEFDVNWADDGSTNPA